jgi:hypothetical protein
LNSGTQIIHSLSSDPDILPLTGYNKNGELVMQIINLKKEPVSVELSHLKSAKLKMITTTEQEPWSENEIVPKIKEGNGIIGLEAESVNTLIF